MVVMLKKTVARVQSLCLMNLSKDYKAIGLNKSATKSEKREVEVLQSVFLLVLLGSHMCLLCRYCDFGWEYSRRLLRVASYLLLVSGNGWNVYWKLKLSKPVLWNARVTLNDRQLISWHCNGSVLDFSILRPRACVFALQPLTGPQRSSRMVYVAHKAIKPI